MATGVDTWRQPRKRARIVPRSLIGAVLLSTGALIAPPLLAQQFDAASVKPSAADASEIRFLPGGRLVATASSLFDLTRRAYGLQGHEIVGGPDWARTALFDITARSERASPASALAALRALLADRFKLATHREARELPIYALVLAREDGRLGSRLRKSSLDCGALLSLRDPGDILALAEQPKCRPDLRGEMREGSVSLTLTRTGTSMRDLAGVLTTFVDRPVVDRTGLAGTWDVQLMFASEAGFTGGPGSSDPLRPMPPASGGLIYSALPEQLGLRLETTRGLVDVVVIDSAERPNAD